MIAKKMKVLPRLGATTLIVACFAASAVLRMIGFAPALAEQMTARAPDSPAPVEVSSPEMTCPDDMAISELLTAIRERQTQLDQQAERIAGRLQLLALAEQKFESQRAALILAEESLAATLAIADKAADNDLEQLTAVYENMKPKSAALIFDSMDVDFSSGFLSRMSPKAAADILSNMGSEQAYAASLIMASRNIRAPTE